MKYLRGYLLIALVSAASFAQAQITNVDTFMHRFFTTLKTNDKQAFIALYPSGDQMKQIMQDAMGKMLNNEQFREQLKKETPGQNIDSMIKVQLDMFTSDEALKDMTKKFERSFDNAISKGENKGVVWSKATLTSYTVDTSVAAEDEVMGLADAGYKSMKGVIDFSVADSAYQASFGEVIFMPGRGWYGGEIKKVVHKGESLKEEEETWQQSGEDSTFMIIDTTAYQVPKEKVKPKAKTKTPPAKTKTKTKTSARKPTVKS